MKIEFYYKYIGIPTLIILIIFSLFMIGWSRTTTEWELTFEVVDKQTMEGVDKINVYYFVLHDDGDLGGLYGTTTDSEGLARLYLNSPMKYIGFVFTDPEGRYKMQLFIPSEDNVRYTVRLSPNPQEERRNSSYKSKFLEEIAGITSVKWIFFLKDEEKAQSFLNELINTIEETVNKNTGKDLNPYSVSISIIELVAGVDIDANDWVGFSDEDREKGIVGKGKYIGPKEKVIDITKTLMGKFYVIPSDPTIFSIGFIDIESNKYHFGDEDKYNEAKELIGKKKIELKEAIIGRASIMWNVHAEARAQNNVIKKVKEIIVLDE